MLRLGSDRIQVPSGLPCPSEAPFRVAPPASPCLTAELAFNILPRGSIWLSVPAATPGGSVRPIPICAWPVNSDGSRQCLRKLNNPSRRVLGPGHAAWPVNPREVFFFRASLIPSNTLTRCDLTGVDRTPRPIRDPERLPLWSDASTCHQRARKEEVRGSNIRINGGRFPFEKLLRLQRCPGQVKPERRLGTQLEGLRWRSGM